MDAKTLKKLADQFDDLAAVITAISGTFRGGKGGDADDAGDGEAEKPVRGTRSRAKPAASKAKAAAESSDLTEDDLREKLKELAGAKGKEKVAEALAEVGAGRLAEVEEGDYQALADAVDKLMAAKAARGSKTKKKAGPTFDEVKEKFTELVEADKAKAKAVLKEAGLTKLSEADADDEGTMQDLMTAIEEALEEDEDLVD